MNILSVLKLIVAGVFFLTILPAQVHALTPDQVFDKVKDAIVVVKTFDSKGKLKGQGSGVIISSGKIATNYNVVKGGASYKVSRGKQIVDATLYAEDQDKDICILDAKSITGKPAQLGKATSLKVGVPVYAVGAPQGLELSLSNGIVAQLRGGPPPFIQTTAAISQGSSGGRLFDGEGRLVGLTTLYHKDGQNLNFAMPVEWISEVKPGRKLDAESRSQTDWVKRVIALQMLKDYQKLLVWSLKWTGSEPENATAWFSLGSAYDQLKRYNDAIEPYRQAIRINPEDANVWYYLGSTYVKLKRDDEAIEAYRQALRINPEDADAWYSLASTYVKLNRYDEAIEAYRQLIRINPEDAGSWKNLGLTYIKLKRFNDAINAYRQALNIDPDDQKAWFFLGQTYRELNRYNDAIEAYHQSLRINPDYANSWYGLGAAYTKLKRYDEAIEAHRQAIRINPDDTLIWVLLVSNYVLNGNRPAALEAVKELRRLDPVNADKLFNMIEPP